MWPILTCCKIGNVNLDLENAVFAGYGYFAPCIIGAVDFKVDIHCGNLFSGEIFVNAVYNVVDLVAFLNEFNGSNFNLWCACFGNG